ncbi:putative reverse transcriptase domain-containing protein [Tanacetum coccineum]
MLDHWVWSLEALGEFLVKSVRSLIDDSLLLNKDVHTRKVNVICIRINVFSWRVCLDKLPTQLNLCLRGMDISSILCPLCNTSVGSAFYLFFACHMALQFWRKASLKVLLCEAVVNLAVRDSTTFRNYGNAFDQDIESTCPTNCSPVRPQLQVLPVVAYGYLVSHHLIIERIGPVAYRLRLPEELIGVHDTFHVSNLKKCLGNANLHVPLNEIKIDKTLRFVEEPVEIMDREVKSLKRSRIPLVKVRWNSKRGPEFTWEREDYMKSKYPQLFVDRAVEPTS